MKIRKEYFENISVPSFNVGDWIVRTEESSVYLKTIDDRRRRGGSYKPRARRVKRNNMTGLFDLLVELDGKNYPESSRYNRLATEEEIIETKLRQLF